MTQKSLLTHLGLIEYKVRSEGNKWIALEFDAEIEKLTGVNSKEMIAKGLDLNQFIHPSDAHLFGHPSNLLKSKRKLKELKYRVRDIKGNEFLVKDVRQITVTKKQMFITGYLIDISAQRMLEQQKDELNKKIKIQQHELEDLNHALKTIMASVEKEKEKVRDVVSFHMTNHVVPMIKILRKKFPAADTLLNRLEFQTGNVMGLGPRKVFLIHNRLSSKEIEICYSIMQGLKGKEIAQQLDISYLTYRTHTKNIRRKLGLKREQNLKLILEEMLYDPNQS